ncbi:MAG TPA: LCP family protein [Acidimicrobiia bacterium]|nr:LCP family protein [Acidimicrobiia bacterium]
MQADTQDETGEPLREPEAPRTRLGWLAFLCRFGIALLVVCIIAAAGLALGDQAGKHEFAQRHVVHIGNGILAQSSPAQPANFLLIGHDADGNSDTMMVVHVDPGNPVPLLVSFPRDLIVDIPGHGQGQLNSAIGLGGPSLLILTFKTDFNIPITHYLQVDFNSFPQIVSAIGKVKVWFPTAVHDPYLGLDIEQPGCVALDGATALKYVRSRHYYVPDDPAHPAPFVWNYDPKLGDGAYRGGAGWTSFEGGTDIGRIPRQQYFLRTLAQTAISRTNDNPLRIVPLVQALMPHLTTDQNLKFSELKSLVDTFRKLKPADVEMTTIPWASEPSNHNRVIVKYPDANTLLFRLANFAPVKAFLPPLVSPSSVRVRVVNGSGIAGLGARALAQLVAAGFRSAGPAADADRSSYVHTQIRWAVNREVQGVTVAYASGAKQSGQALKASDTAGVDVLVVVGRDWNTLQHHFTGLPAARPRATRGTTVTSTTTTSTTLPLADRPYVPVSKTGGVLVGCPRS